jgi:hypothetical protein
MTKKFGLINNISGWVVFVVAFITYYLTMEPTASFWDCGEFISASYKLEVGHPPGAPFFLLMGNFFSLFAGSDVTQVARWVNTMSVLMSALTILFLFWSISHLVRKIVNPADSLSLSDTLIIIISALTGSLAYTFSDTFWFSAVEGEVYATSSLLTALVFWAILKWENVADQRHSNRWIIFIAYIMGLSIGVHLLNLLAIPAIVYVYYFRKYKVSVKGVIYAALVSVALLAVVLYIIFPGVTRIATIFELAMVNGLGLPYNSGAILYVFALFGALAYGIWYSLKKQKVLLNHLITGLTVIVIGYFSYASILIRSSAEPPMDQNDPQTVFSLLSYLNREQYGQSPLFRGNYYNAPITGSKENKKIYSRQDGKYVVNSYRPKLIYDDRFTTVFPRMWSADPDHIEQYRRWGKIKGIPITVSTRGGEQEVRYKPTFSENLRFFFRYQVGYMYLRYFMWNFTGRQNDLQGYGEFYKGNWLSGIRFIDEARLGPQDKLPAFMKNNPARNTYYFLPLLLGLLGMIWQYRKLKKDFWIVLMLFVMTGLAIVLYLNQYPLQPRERDYAYAGSFYAFSIWIGLGFTALAVSLRKLLPGPVSVLLLALPVLVFVPGLMARENWDDHDRSGRYTARDFAANYLNSCAPDAILFTNGDNDTFPLWYVQEVEGVRTDVRVVNLSYLGAEWYIRQMARKAYESDPVPWKMNEDLYTTGKRDIVYLVDRITDYVSLSEAMNFIRSEDPRTKQFGSIRERIDYIPAKRFRMAVDKERIRETGTVSPEMMNLVVPEMRWQLNQDNIGKNGLMVMDLVENNNWERPIYFAVTVSSDLYMNLDDYFQLEGLAYRLVPIYNPGSQGQLGSIDNGIMFDNLINKFVWGNMNDSTVYLDETNLRMLTNIRNNFGRLALSLIREGKVDSAKIVLDRCMELMPSERVPFNYFMIPVIEAYNQLGETDMARQYLEVLSDITNEELLYFLTVDQKYTVLLAYEKQLRLHIMQETVRLARQFGTEEMKVKYEERFQQLLMMYSAENK